MYKNLVQHTTPPPPPFLKIEIAVYNIVSIIITNVLKYECLYDDIQIYILQLLLYICIYIYVCYMC